MAQDTTNKSEYTQTVEVLTKELMKLAEGQKKAAETGLIVISVNAEAGSDHQEIILSMVGRRNAIKAGLEAFAESKDNDMREIFFGVIKEQAEKMLFKRLFREMCKKNEEE